jgi:hypothetical protein
MANRLPDYKQLYLEAQREREEEQHRRREAEYAYEREQCRREEEYSVCARADGGRVPTDLNTPTT